MNPTDLAFSSALDQAALIRSGEISPLELTQVYLDRIARHNDRLGAYITVAEERAIKTAKQQNEQWSQCDRAGLPPFFGVPMPIKDLAPVAGLPCMRGLAALRDRIAEYTPAHVQAIEAAGFNLLGKTSTSELGSMPFTEPMGLPSARNPWHLDYTPGGSSGGAAAAVAAGLAPLAHGSDGGGSVRGPAGCCGLVGFKPSRGRISQAPEGEHLMGLATPGPLTRTVRDAAALLDVMAGYVLGDPYWLPNPEISFLEQTQQAPPHLKIAVASEIPRWPIHRDCQAAVERTAKQLGQLGHELGVGCPDFSDLAAPFQQIFASAIAATGVPPEALSPINRWLMEQAGTAGELWQSMAQLRFLSRQIVGFFVDWDILLLPTYAHPIIKIGEWADRSPEETFDAVSRWVMPCPPFNATGQPAISLPAGFDERGLPMSVQLVGKPGADAQVLQLAAQLEGLEGWTQHRPPETVS